MEYKNESLEKFNKKLSESKVAIIGLGTSNIPLLDYMNELNADTTVFDNRLKENIPQEIIDKITNYNFKYYFGNDSLNNLRNFDIIFRGGLLCLTYLCIESIGQEHFLMWLDKK